MTDPTPEPGRADPTGSSAATSPEATDSARDRYADRYGRRTARPNRRLIGSALTGVVVLAGIGIAYLGWAQFGPKDIESEELGYTVLDDSSVEVQIRLTRDDPSKPVVCLVRAMSRDLEEVGRREVLVQPTAGEHTVRVSTVVEASQRPASAAIYTCTDHVPGYLRTE
ncbi:DUF4307 domain-containing protein [Nocardia jinanensis]|uniref:DUF4307 domain-containing protein n=1 Tax=Nocardia jinanensis TaxID=382504 RepID=A0A917VWA1_9NOCA|nr:DUF4307 domain-containing protein [Nocardia jinanensis]GGL30632.1 hypothetical protein GCM10011588_51720 [Nocardia jinanensis]